MVIGSGHCGKKFIAGSAKTIGFLHNFVYFVSIHTVIGMSVAPFQYINYSPLTLTTLETPSIDAAQPNLPQRRSLYNCGYRPTQTRQGRWW
jgi:hypothetical protein